MSSPRLERGTCCLGGSRSIHLSYEDVDVRDHLIRKEKAGISHSHLKDLEHRLRLAIAHFGAGRDPRTIEPADVSEWADELAKDGRRGPGTVRHYLNALSGLYGRAQEGLYVDPKYNPVSMLQEKPTGHRKREAAFFEVAEAALLLEAARVLEERGRGRLGEDGHRINATPGLYPIVAAFLLTGGRNSEVLGLDVEDVSFDRGIIRFRPNKHRGLKTSTSHRVVPLWPQLREILQAWMWAGENPHTSGLLFRSASGGMVGDLRKSLDQIGAMCGLDEGEVRTRRFRHTYCSARLQTVQRIVRPGKDPATDGEDAWEYVEVSKFQVQKEMGHGGAQLVDRIYGHAQRDPHRSEVVEYRVEKHGEALGKRLRALAVSTP
jgi:integrase